MVDDQNSNDTPLNDPSPDQGPQSSDTGQQSSDPGDEPRVKRRRPVYEPTLFEEKKRFRVPRQIAIPGLIVVCGILFYFLVIVPKQRHHFDTVGKLVYSGDLNNSGQTHLFLMNSDGTAISQLSPGSGSDTVPAFAPDGNQIAFVSNRDGSTKQLYVIDPDGTNRLQLTRTVGVKGNPAFAPVDYDTIGFTSAGILETINPSSGTVETILPVLSKTVQTGTSDAAGAASPTTVDSFVWSPDKTPSLAWWEQPVNSILQIFGQSNSPKSKQGLAAVEETNGEDQLAIQPTLDGDAITTVGTPPNTQPIMSAQKISLAWSPDDKTLAVAVLGFTGYRNMPKFSGILFMDRSTGHPLLTPPLFGIPNDQVGPQSPAYSPDGTTLVCQVLQQPDITTTVSQGLGYAKLDGSIPGRIVISGDIEQPKFSPDGKYLYFIQSVANGVHALRRADLAAHTIKNISDPTTDVTSYDVSPQVKN